MPKRILPPTITCRPIIFSLRKRDIEAIALCMEEREIQNRSEFMRKLIDDAIGARLGIMRAIWEPVTFKEKA